MTLGLVRMARTYHLRVFVLVRVCFHVPNHLVCKQLGKLRRFQDITLNITQSIVSESLDELRNKVETDINGMTF